MASRDDDGDRLVITLRVPDGVDREEAIRVVGELTRLLDDYHKAMGGSGLVVESWTITEDDEDDEDDEDET